MKMYQFISEIMKENKKREMETQNTVEKEKQERSRSIEKTWDWNFRRHKA